MELTTVSVSKSVKAPSEKLFEIWLDPKCCGSPWFGAERSTMNAVVGGLFYLAIKHEGTVWPHFGRFLKIEPPHIVEYSWMSPATQGLESYVQIIFDQKGDHTDLTLTHSGLPDDALGKQHKDGWEWVLSMLATKFA